jgi:protein-disulfide isomerase
MAEVPQGRVSVTMFRLSEKLIVHGGVFMARKSSRWIAGLAVASAAMLMVVAGSLSATKDPAAQTKAAHVDLAAEKSMGTKSAPITLEVYSDFQCPSCRLFFLNATTPLMNDYVASGKVYFIHHDFPLPMHAHSHDAAKWANAAAEIGKFREVEAALYQKQDAWGATGKIDDALDNVLTPTEMKRVRGLLDSPEVTASIQHDEDLAKAKGLTGTPSIFIIHKGQTFPLPAAGTTYNLLKQYIDYLLAQ